MCFHSKQTKNAITAEKRFNAAINNLVDFQPREHINGFEFPKTPVIANSDTELIDAYHWGLIPHWAKDEKIRQYTLNAKIETLHEKPSYRDNVKNRCLILTDGFYEWQWLDPKGKKKQKYVIGLPDGELFAFAGIWSEWTSTMTGEIVRTYSIVTTEAQGIMKEIHNSKLRMPVILTSDNEREWLQNKQAADFATVNVELHAEKC